MRQPIKFYVDEHVATAVVKGLRQRGADVLTVLEAGVGWRRGERLMKIRLIASELDLNLDLNLPRRLEVDGLTQAA
jgi:hypothetical protein